jgi:DNA-binding response OmpR family regulator
MPPSPTPGLRVLLVEDQHDIAANIWDFLERRGHEVDHCADGASGLARARQGGFDAIVLDLGLPRLDGLEMCRILRDAGNGVPVLMLTARDTLDDIVRGFAHGADDYMVKPFALKELDARLRALHRRTVPAARPVGGATLTYDAGTMTARREGRSIRSRACRHAVLETLLSESPRIVAARPPAARRLGQRRRRHGRAAHPDVRTARARRQTLRHATDPVGARRRLPGDPHA